MFLLSPPSHPGFMLQYLALPINRISSDKLTYKMQFPSLNLNFALYLSSSEYLTDIYGKMTKTIDCKFERYSSYH